MKRGGTDVEMDLFPFLSILVCIMGVLTLLITGIVLSQINPEAVAEVEERIKDEVDLSADLQKLDDQLLEAMKRLEELQKQSPPRAPEDRLAALDQEIAATDKKIIDRNKTRQAAATEADKLQDAIDQMRARIEELKPELAARQAHLEKLEQELAARKDAAKGPAVRVLPSGTGSIGNKRPVFVDCDAVSVTLYTGPEPVTVQLPQLGQSPEWLALTKRVADAKNEVLVFLIRRDGMGAYRNASASAERNGAVTGKIPVPFDGRLDLSLFLPKGK